MPTKSSAWDPLAPKTVKSFPGYPATPQATSAADKAMQKAVLKILSDTTDAINQAWEAGNAAVAAALKDYAGGPYHLGATCAGVAGTPVAGKRKLVLYVCHNGAPVDSASLGVGVTVPGAVGVTVAGPHL